VSILGALGTTSTPSGRLKPGATLSAHAFLNETARFNFVYRSVIVLSLCPIQLFQSPRPGDRPDRYGLVLPYFLACYVNSERSMVPVSFNFVMASVVGKWEPWQKPAQWSEI